MRMRLVLSDFSRFNKMIGYLSFVGQTLFQHSIQMFHHFITAFQITGCILKRWIYRNRNERGWACFDIDGLLCRWKQLCANAIIPSFCPSDIFFIYIFMQCDARDAHKNSPVILITLKQYTNMCSCLFQPKYTCYLFALRWVTMAALVPKPLPCVVFYQLQSEWHKRSQFL